MTDRPPPSLGTYRPQKGQGPDFEEPNLDGLDVQASDGPGAGLPRVVTQRRVARDGDRTAGQRRRASRPVPDAGEGFSALRLLAYLLAGLVAFSAAAVTAALLLVPTDLVRDRLQAEARARTGRDLVIAGRSSLTLWPRPSVIVRDVTLAGPPQMGPAPLLHVGEIELAVQLLPLLVRDVAVDRLVLRHVSIDMRIDATGRRSWDFAEAEPFVRLAQAAAPNGNAVPKELQDFMRGSINEAARAPGTVSAAGRGVRLTDLTLGNVGIADGTVRLRDDRRGFDETISALDVQFSLANLTRPLDTKAEFTWRGERVAMTAQVAPVRALLEGRAVQAQIKSKAGPLAWTFDGSLTPNDGLDADGRLTASGSSLEKLARWTGRPLTGSLPGAFSVDTRIKQTAAMIALDDARLTVGPFDGTGALTVETRGPRPFVKGTVRLTTLDLNVLRALVEGAPQVQPPAPPATVPASIEDLLKAAPAPVVPPARQVRGFTKRDGWSDEAIDLTPLGLADADVRFGFDRVVWQDVATGAGQLGITLKAKVARITLDDMHLYDGLARGLVTIDGTGADAVVGGNLTADGVSALPFLKALGGFDWLSGRAHTAIAVAGRGTTERQIVSSLTGKADITITEGALLGLSLQSIMRNVAQGRLAGLDRSPSEKTEFSAFAASAQIANGIARNDDLRVTSQDLRATGAGTIDLPQRTMDYLLRPKLTMAAGLEVPLKITGSIDKPTVTPQIAGLLRDPNQALQALDAASKTPAGKDLQDTVKGALNGDPAATAKVKGFLDQLFKK